MKLYSVVKLVFIGCGFVMVLSDRLSLIKRGVVIGYQVTKYSEFVGLDQIKELVLRTDGTL